MGAKQEVPPHWTIQRTFENQRRWFEGIEYLAGAEMPQNVGVLSSKMCRSRASFGGLSFQKWQDTRFWNSEDLTLKKVTPQCNMIIWWLIMICTKHDIVMFGFKNILLIIIHYPCCLPNLISEFHGIMTFSYQILLAVGMTVDIWWSIIISVPKIKCTSNREETTASQTSIC